MGVCSQNWFRRAEYTGGPYTYDDKGCFLANFKPERRLYCRSNFIYSEAESYWPNDYGLYNMSGNVSEWTDLTLTKQQMILLLV